MSAIRQKKNQLRYQIGIVIENTPAIWQKKESIQIAEVPVGLSIVTAEFTAHDMRINITNPSLVT